MNGEQIWQAAQEELRFQLSKPSYETWLKNASLVGREKNAFKIGVPTKLAKDWLEDRYSAMIKETLSAIVSGDVSVAFEVVPGQPEVQGGRAAVAVAEEPPPEEEDPVLHEASQLNPKFQFQHFVVGNNSRFAHAACRAVAETPAKAYNPLFLYGGGGGGEGPPTHAIRPPLRARRRTAGESLHPALPLRRGGSWQDPPDARHRPRGAGEARPPAGRLRDQREVYERDDLLDPGRTNERFSDPLPDGRRPAGRRYPVPRRQRPHPGRVLPYLQLPARAQQADRHLVGPAAGTGPHPRGPAALAVSVGSDRGHPGGRFRDARRHPQVEGWAVRAAGAGGCALLHRPQDPEEHPRARGCADSRDRPRLPQPQRRQRRDGGKTAAGCHSLNRDSDALDRHNLTDRGELLPHQPRGDEGQAARQAHRISAAGGDVLDPRGNGVVPAGDRPGLRRT